MLNLPKYGKIEVNLLLPRRDRLGEVLPSTVRMRENNGTIHCCVDLKALKICILLFSLISNFLQNAGARDLVFKRIGYRVFFG